MILSMQRFLKKNAREGLGFIMLLALVLGVISVPIAMRKADSDIWALRVNGEPVGYTRFMREVFQYKEFIASLKSTYGQFANYILSSMGMSTQPEQIAIDKLIRQELLDQLGLTIGLRVHSDYIALKIKDPEFMRNFVSESALKSDGVFDMNILRRELSHYGLSIAEFEEALNQGIKRDFLMKLFEIGFYVPQFDTNYIYSMRRAVRNIVILEFPYEHLLQRIKQEPISEEDAQNYFLIRNKSSMQYWSDEYRDGVVFKIAKASYDTTVPEQDIINYYEQHKLKKYTKTPAKVIVQKITNTDFNKQFPAASLTDILNATDQEQYANLWQEIEPFSRGTYQESLERAAFGLKKPGDLSSVVTLDDGTSLILRLVQIVPREYMPFDAVKDAIYKELKTNTFKKQFVAETQDLIRKGDIAQFASLSDVEKVSLSRATSDSNDPLIKRLFEINRIGDAITYVDNDYGYVIQLLHIDPSAELPFEQVKQYVLDDMYAEKAHKEMGHLLNTLQSKISDQGIESVVNAYGATVLFDGQVRPDVESEMKKIEKHGVNSELITFLDKKNMAYILKTEPSGTIIYAKEVTIPQELTTTENNDEFREISKEKLSLETSALVASFYRNANIEINELIRGNRSEE